MFRKNQLYFIKHCDYVIALIAEIHSVVNKMVLQFD
jgi:hypothetical protein